MYKVTNINTTQLSTKPATLMDITEEGFLIENEDGNEIITFETIQDYFKGKVIKIKIEEVVKKTLDE